MDKCKNCSRYNIGFKKVDIDRLLGDSSYNGEADLRWKRMKGVIDKIIK